jgi:excisionase family DNA binding protein
MSPELVLRLNCDGYLTKKQAAEYLAYSTKTVERFMKCGLKYYEMAEGPRFKKADLDSFAQQFVKGAA